MNSLRGVFADDIAIFQFCQSLLIRTKNLNLDMDKVSSWAFLWRVQLDEPKFKAINFSLKEKCDHSSANPILRYNHFVHDEKQHVIRNSSVPI